MDVRGQKLENVECGCPRTVKTDIPLCSRQPFEASRGEHSRLWKTPIYGLRADVNAVEDGGWAAEDVEGKCSEMSTVSMRQVEREEKGSEYGEWRIMRMLWTSSCHPADSQDRRAKPDERHEANGRHGRTAAAFCGCFLRRLPHAVRGCECVEQRPT